MPELLSKPTATFRPKTVTPGLIGCQAYDGFSQLSRLSCGEIEQTDHFDHDDGIRVNAKALSYGGLIF